MGTIEVGDYITTTGSDSTGSTFTVTGNVVYITGTSTASSGVTISTAGTYTIKWCFDSGYDDFDYCDNINYDEAEDIDPEEERKEIEDKLHDFLQKEMKERLYFGESIETLNQLTKDLRLGRYWDEEKEEEVEEQFCNYLQAEMKRKLYFGQRNEVGMLDRMIKSIQIER